MVTAPNVLNFSPYDDDQLTGLDRDSQGRVQLAVSFDDVRRYDAIERRSVESAVMTDVNTGRSWRVRRASCGLRCYCSAAIVEEVDPPGAANRDGKHRLQN